MSSRALRKLQESRNKQDDDEEVESEEEVRNTKNHKGFNAFLLVSKQYSQLRVIIVLLNRS